MENNQRQKSIKTAFIAFLVLTIISAALLAYYAAFGYGTDYNFVSVSDEDLPSGEYDTNTVLCFDNMIIIDEYAKYGGIFAGTDEDDFDSAYFLVLVTDKYSAYFASLEVDADSDIYSSLKKYLESSDMKVGDLVLPVCAIESELPDTELENYYAQQLDYYSGTIADEGLTVDNLAVNYRYASDTKANFSSYEKSEKHSETVKLCVIIAITAYLAVMTAVYGGKHRKLKKAADLTSDTQSPDTSEKAVEETNETHD